MIPFYFKLEFEETKNVAKYESLIIGLQTTKQMGDQSISVFGDSKLIIKKIKYQCQTKHPRLRAYRNDAMDILKKFMEYELVFVPRSQNVIANGLACLDSSYPKTPVDQQIVIQTKFRSAVPDNEKYWQVFEGDKQIEDFLVNIAGIKKAAP